MRSATSTTVQVEPPYAIDDIIWPGTFTVDAGALTLPAAAPVRRRLRTAR